MNVAEISMMCSPLTHPWRVRTPQSLEKLERDLNPLMKMSASVTLPV